MPTSLTSMFTDSLQNKLSTCFNNNRYALSIAEINTDDDNIYKNTIYLVANIRVLFFKIPIKIKVIPFTILDLHDSAIITHFVIRKGISGRYRSNRMCSENINEMVDDILNTSLMIIIEKFKINSENIHDREKELGWDFSPFRGLPCFKGI